MPKFSRFLACACLIALPCISAPASSQESKPAAATAMTPAEQLKKLFADSDQASLKRNPISAIYRGDLRYADQFGDYLSENFYRTEIAAQRSELAALRKINRAALNETDQLAYDVFEFGIIDALKGLKKSIYDLTIVRPMDHFNGFHTFYPSFESGQGGAPFNTLTDYENSLKRHKGYAVVVDRAITRMRQGLKSGVVQPKLTVRNMVEQLDALLVPGTEKSTFLAPTEKFPAAILATDQARLKTAFAASVRDVINPAHKRLRDFLDKEYLPKARDSVGLSGMKGGKALYPIAIASNTTLPMTAEAIHTLGLSEVSRIRAEMESIKQKVGYSGTLKQFFDHVRTDPKFKPASKQALVDGYYKIGKTVDERIGKLFSTLPKTPLEIRFYEPYREKNQAGGSYDSGMWDPKDPKKNRPGVFYFNTYDLPSRTTPGMETLYLHEGAPGHHFQISLAQENEALPPFMRYGGNTAFVEGWALYAETLYDELGMQNDPMSRFGGLDDEMLRAMRLVVDSGLHSKNWSREQAIKYMLDNSSMGETDAKNEVERYIVWPGQALAYKVGQLTILRLRAEAEKALGSKFDLKDFHAQILMTGALPMTVLEKKIRNWIAVTQKS